MVSFLQILLVKLPRQDTLLRLVVEEWFIVVSLASDAEEYGQLYYEDAHVDEEGSQD